MGSRKINPDSIYGQAYALSQELGLNHKTVYARMSRGWTAEHIRQGKKPRNAPINGRVQQVADMVGLSKWQVYSRLRKGETLDGIMGQHNTKVEKPSLIKLIKTLPPKARLFCGVAA